MTREPVTSPSRIRRTKRAALVGTGAAATTGTLRAIDEPSEKLKETIHFVCRTLGRKSGVLGAVKLQKILWYFDARAYLATGYACTGAAFFRGFHGPYAPQVREAIVQLVRERRFFSNTTQFYDNDNARFLAALDRIVRMKNRDGERAEKRVEGRLKFDAR